MRIPGGNGVRPQEKGDPSLLSHVSHAPGDGKQCWRKRPQGPPVGGAAKGAAPEAPSLWGFPSLGPTPPAGAPSSGEHVQDGVCDEALAALHPPRGEH